MHKTKLKIYLGGPMTGHPDFNFPLFNEAASALRAMKHEVFNPAEHDVETTPGIVWEPGYDTGDPCQTRLFDARQSFQWDFARILEADAIALLPDWETSKGAGAERLVAEKTGKLILLLSRVFPGGNTWKLETDPVQVRMWTGVATENWPKVTL